jgi:lysyl-tRNA synthetase class 2
MYQLEIRDVIGSFIDEAFDYSDNDETIKAFLEGMIAAIPIIVQELKWHEEDDKPAVYPDDFPSASSSFVCPESTVISKVEYWPKVKELFVQFRKTGKIYAYQNVPPNVYSDLLHADSKGKQFNQHIKTKFEFVDVSDKGEL